MTPKPSETLRKTINTTPGLSAFCRECSSVGDVDFLEGRLMVIGKRNSEASVRISERAMAALS